MSWPRLVLTRGFPLILACFGLAPARTPALFGAEPSPSPAVLALPQQVIKSEANIVLVDVVVTDKKKHYLKDLTQQDFHVYEDGVEQSIASFTREEGPKPHGSGNPRYMVLLFDNTVTSLVPLMAERQAAAKFVEITASSKRMMAVVSFDQALRVVQNFTADRDLLDAAIKTPGYSPVQAQAPAPQGFEPRADQPISNFATRDLLAAFRDIAQMVGAIPGRKIIIYLSEGFDVGGEQANLQSTIQALNKANIGVYPANVQGMAAIGHDLRPDRLRTKDTKSAALAMMDEPLEAGNSHHQVLYYLASHTGGLAMVDMSDLTAGMQQICEELEDTYVLGYVPSNPVHDGSYHKIRVKVSRAGAEVRARDGYVDLKSPDLLAGKTEGKALEARAAAPAPGEVPILLSAPYFYVQPGVAMVSLALSVPGASIDFVKQKGSFHSQVDVLGIAYREDNSVAARFSDTVSLDYSKQEEQEVARIPFVYRKCFKIAPGTYLLKVVLSAGEQRFGKSTLPLAVDPFTGKGLALAGPAFGDQIVMMAPPSADLDEALLENTKPLIANGVQVIPSASNRFAKDGQVVAYVEVYNPLLKAGNVQVGIQFNIVERTTNQAIFSSPTMPINQFTQAGNPLVPLAFRLPIDKLPPGDYRMEIQGHDSAGNTSAVRKGDFSIQ